MLGRAGHILNVVTGQPEAACLTQSVVVSSVDAGWSGVGVEHLRLPPYEPPETCRQDHLLRIQLARPVTLGWKSGGRFRDQPMAPGDLCLVPAGVPHQVRWREDSEILRIRLAPSLLDEDGLAPALSGRLELTEQWGQPDPQVQHIGLALRAELEAGCPGGRLFRDALTTALTIHLARRYSTGPVPPPPTGPAGLSKSDLRRATEYLHDNLARDVSLAEVAAAVHLSPSHFVRLFKRSTGQTPHQYLLHCRIERAKTLLLNARLTAGQVAQETGFADQSHFTRQFKRLSGTTPAAFAKYR